MITKPLIKGTFMMCNVLRKKDTKWGLTYVCYFDKNERFLMAAKKKPNTLSPNYQITIGADNFEDPKNFVGKVKSNVIGTIFDIWDNGKKITKATGDNNVRISRGCITYVSTY